MSESRSKKKVLGSMNVDFNGFDEQDTRGEYVYTPPNVMSDRKRAVYLEGWSAEDVRNVDEQMSVYRDVPIECKAESCVFARRCPLVKNGLVSRWVGEPCPIQVIEAFRYFAGYVNDLNIQPAEFTDLQMVNDLVRLQLRMSQCDRELQLERPTEIAVEGKDTKTSLQYSQRKMNSLLEAQRAFREQQFKLYTQLVATRQAKLEASTKKISEEDISVQLSRAMAEVKKKRESNVPNPRMQKLEIRDE